MMLTVNDWLNVFVAVCCAGYAAYLAHEIGNAIQSMLND
jgi:hypothetical protein